METNNNEIAKQATPTTQREVYVMPEKFRLTKTTGSNRGIIISVLILLSVIILNVTYFVYDSWQRSKIVQQPAAKNQPPVIELSSEIDNDLIASTTINEETKETTSTFTTTTIIEEIATSTTSTIQTQFSLDSDNDGLTDIEEVIFGTAPTNPDTDGDGYKDGIEVINGYSPIKAGNFRVSSSPFIASVVTDFDADNFRLYYPKDWRLSLSKAAKQLVLTINTGEVITVTVKDNVDKIPTISWYVQQYPQTPVSQLRIVDSRDLTGVYSPDGLSAYLTNIDKSKFYVFEYIVGRQSEIRYPAIFNMLIKQIELLPNSPISSNNSTTTNTTNSEFTYTAATCPNFFCALTPCGLQPDGSNSCEINPPKGACYLNACQSDVDCLNGLTCQEVDCYSGDVLISSKVCK